MTNNIELFYPPRVICVNYSGGFYAIIKEWIIIIFTRTDN